MRGLLFLGAEDHGMDIVAWLRGLRLEQYAPAFRDNEVDGDVLPDLTAEDLIGLGVTLIGHRRKLLSAIAALGAAAPAPALTATPASVLPPAPAPAQAERRQLTVMFCDLVGSTALSTGMDREDLRDVIASFQNRCSAAIRRYDGFVAKFMGDGILVYFGFPRAHEDQAERSVRAGLDIVDAMAELNAAIPRPPGVELAVRIGIATGPVIVGDQIGEGTASETAVVGETPNLAARLQALAQPNQIVVSAATRAMLGDHFDLEDRDGDGECTDRMLCCQPLRGAPPLHFCRKLNSRLCPLPVLDPRPGMPSCPGSATVIGNAGQRHFGVQRIGGFRGGLRQGGLPRPINHRSCAVSGAPDRDQIAPAPPVRWG